MDFSSAESTLYKTIDVVEKIFDGFARIYGYAMNYSTFQPRFVLDINKLNLFIVFSSLREIFRLFL